MLTLPIKKKWFDMILNGEKKEEYRDIKSYYRSRFSNAIGDHITSEVPTIKVRFRNGYCSYSPSFIALCKLYVDCGKEEWGAEPNKKYYVLKILEVLEK